MYTEGPSQVTQSRAAPWHWCKCNMVQYGWTYCGLLSPRMLVEWQQRLASSQVPLFVLFLRRHRRMGLSVTRLLGNIYIYPLFLDSSSISIASNPYPTLDIFHALENPLSCPGTLKLSTSPSSRIIQLIVHWQRTTEIPCTLSSPNFNPRTRSPLFVMQIRMSLLPCSGGITCPTGWRLGMRNLFRWVVGWNGVWYLS